MKSLFILLKWRPTLDICIINIVSYFYLHFNNNYIQLNFRVYRIDLIANQSCYLSWNYSVFFYLKSTMLINLVSTFFINLWIYSVYLSWIYSAFSWIYSVYFILILRCLLILNLQRFSLNLRCLFYFDSYVFIYLSTEERSIAPAPQRIARACRTVFRDDFNGAFDPSHWNYEVSMYGGYVS